MSNLSSLSLSFSFIIKSLLLLRVDFSKSAMLFALNYREFVNCVRGESVFEAVKQVLEARMTSLFSEVFQCLWTCDECFCSNGIVSYFIQKQTPV